VPRAPEDRAHFELVERRLRMLDEERFARGSAQVQLVDEASESAVDAADPSARGLRAYAQAMTDARVDSAERFEESPIF
jgi:hypothetical protein